VSLLPCEINFVGFLEFYTDFISHSNIYTIPKLPMKHIAQTFIITILFFGLTAITLAQEPTVTELNNTWDYEFRNHLVFNLSAESDQEITEAFLFYKIVGQIATSRNEVELTPTTQVEATFELDQTKPIHYLPPGSQIEYWWKLVSANGGEYKTERQQLLYTDNRQTWQELTNDRLTLYWYEGDEQFGQILFDRANLALDTLEQDVGITIEEPIKIFIYGNHNDLMSSLATTAQEWTGGVAFTDFGVVLLGINPSQEEWGLRAMSHEMTHLVVHQATDNPYGDMPRWLDEGIAVHNENKDDLVDDFKPILETAIAQNSVQTLRTLSSPFSSDPMEANLAYGQSGAVVKFMIKEYGSESMAALLDIFSEGALYDEALESALGIDMDQLDSAWRVSVGLEPLPGVEVAASNNPETDPNLADEPQAPTIEEAEETVPEVEAVPTVTEDIPITEAEPVPVEPVTETSNPLSSLPCVGGLLPLFAIGLTLFVGQHKLKR